MGEIRVYREPFPVLNTEGTVLSVREGFPQSEALTILHFKNNNLTFDALSSQLWKSYLLLYPYI